MDCQPINIREFEEIAKYELAIGMGHSVSGNLGVLRDAATIRVDYDRATYQGPVYVIFSTLRELLGRGPDVYVRGPDGAICAADEYLRVQALSAQPRQDQKRGSNS